MTQPIYIEKLVTFTYRDGRFDVALFSGEFAPGVKCYRLKIPVPVEIVAQETVIAEVERMSKKDLDREPAADIVKPYEPTPK